MKDTKGTAKGAVAKVVPPARGLFRLTEEQADKLALLCFYTLPSQELPLFFYINFGLPVEIGLPIREAKFSNRLPELVPVEFAQAWVLFRDGRELATTIGDLIKRIWSQIQKLDAKLSSLCARSSAAGEKLGLPTIICGDSIEAGTPAVFEKFEPGRY